MNLLAEYLAAAFPEPCRLLGVELRPFSLGHMTLLQWLGNAFVVGGAPGVEDLVTGTWVCSLKFAEARDALRGGRLTIVERGRWRTRRRTVLLTDAFSRWRKLIGPFDAVAKSAEFARYLQAGCQAPVVAAPARPGSGAEPGQLPDVQAVKVTLMARLHIPEAEVMDRSWSMCLWDCYTLGSMDGALKFLDRDALAQAQAGADNLKELIDSGKVKII